MQSVTKLKVLDLFSGIGMFSYGLEKTGLYETTAFSEWDDKCKEVINRNFPGINVFGDISDIEGVDSYVMYKYYESGAREGAYDLFVGSPVDIITGGFPCQDISNSGSKEGITGGRSKYWKEFKRLIESVKPKGVIIENVSALRHRGLGVVLSDLSKIGYDAEWHCIPASYFGAIHTRDRCFILAYPNSIRRKEPWKPLEPINTEEIRNREAGIIRHALQRSRLPYLCGDHARGSRGVDRLKQLGNTVYWPIVKTLGEHMYENLKSMGLVSPIYNTPSL